MMIVMETMMLMNATMMVWTTKQVVSQQTKSDRVNARILREMHHLSSWFNPITNKVIDQAEAAKKPAIPATINQEGKLQIQ